MLCLTASLLSCIQTNTTYAAKMLNGVMSKYFVDEMSTILDDGRKVTHEKLASRVEAVLDDDKFWKKVKGLAEVSVPAFESFATESDAI